MESLSPQGKAWSVVVLGGWGEGEGRWCGDTSTSLRLVKVQFFSLLYLCIRFHVAGPKAHVGVVRSSR